MAQEVENTTPQSQGTQSSATPDNTEQGGSQAQTPEQGQGQTEQGGDTDQSTQSGQTTPNNGAEQGGDTEQGTGGGGSEDSTPPTDTTTPPTDQNEQQGGDTTLPDTTTPENSGTGQGGDTDQSTQSGQTTPDNGAEQGGDESGQTTTPPAENSGDSGTGEQTEGESGQSGESTGNSTGEGQSTPDNGTEQGTDTTPPTDQNEQQGGDTTPPDTTTPENNGQSSQGGDTEGETEQGNQSENTTPPADTTTPPAENSGQTEQNGGDTTPPSSGQTTPDNGTDTTPPSTDTTTPPTPQKPSIPLEPIDNALLNQIKQSLQENASFIEQSRLSLMASAEVYGAFLRLEILYNHGINDVSDKSARIDNVLQEIESKKQALDTQMSEASKILQTSLEQNTLISERVSQNLSASLEGAKLIEEMLEEARSKHNELLATHASITSLLALLQSLEPQKDEYVKITQELKAHIENAKIQKEQIITEIEAIKEAAKTALADKKAALELELLAQKEQISEGLEGQRDEIIKAFDSYVTLIEEKQEELELSFAAKQNTLASTFARLDELNTKITEASATIEATKQEVLDTIAGSVKELRAQGGVVIDTIEQSKEAANTAIDNAKSELETKKQEYLTELQTATTTHTSELGQAAQTHTTSLSELQTSIQTKINDLSEDVHDKLDSVAAAQIAGLTSLVNEIKGAQTALGQNFQHQNFTSSGTFTPQEGALYHFVFCQGGTGASYSTAAGGVTSFGSLLSANGGSGSEQGVGQKGECVGGFVEVSGSVNVNVGSGGICIVSWSSK